MITLSEDGSRLRCMTESNPPADYRWTTNSSGLTCSRHAHSHCEQELDLCSIENFTQLRRLECEVRNSVTSQTRTEAFNINATLREDIINICSQ